MYELELHVYSRKQVCVCFNNVTASEEIEITDHTYSALLGRLDSPNP